MASIILSGINERTARYHRKELNDNVGEPSLEVMKLET